MIMRRMEPSNAIVCVSLLRGIYTYIADFLVDGEFSNGEDLAQADDNISEQEQLHLTAFRISISLPQHHDHPRHQPQVVNIPSSHGGLLLVRLQHQQS